MPPPRLNALATAVPAHVIDRRAAMDCARAVFGPEVERWLGIFAKSGIERRHSCLPVDWYRQPHGWAERSALFAGHALDLAERAARACLDRAGLDPDQVDAVVAVTTSGVCTPSLDALLMERMGLRPDVVRLPLFGLGCGGGVLGLARAAQLARALPGARVLLAVVETCMLTFRPNDRSPANVVATALFGDGAAAALVSTAIDGPAIALTGEHTWPGTLDVMGWRVEDDGFGVLFSADIPALVRQHFRPALECWLGRHGLGLDEVGGFALHPGGAKVVAALEDALGLVPGRLAHERAVLRDFGNMSAATALFVLERALSAPLPARTLMAALGPGFTAGFLMLEEA
jgi:alkylresorcinol/alkylpyrone synthase